MLLSPLCRLGRKCVNRGVFVRLLIFSFYFAADVFRFFHGSRAMLGMIIVLPFLFARATAFRGLWRGPCQQALEQSDWKESQIILSVRLLLSPPVLDLISFQNRHWKATVLIRKFLEFCLAPGRDSAPSQTSTVYLGGKGKRKRKKKKKRSRDKLKTNLISKSWGYYVPLHVRLGDREGEEENGWSIVVFSGIRFELAPEDILSYIP